MTGDRSRSLRSLHEFWPWRAITRRRWVDDRNRTGEFRAEHQGHNLARLTNSRLKHHDGEVDTSDTDITNENFLNTWQTLGTQIEGVDDSVWAKLGGELLDAYSEPVRRYHTAVHVLAVLRTLEEITSVPSVEQQLAAFIHDAIYDPTAEGYANEEASAGWAEVRLPEAGVSPDVVAASATLTRATAGHRLDETDGCAEFLDADLAILAAPANTYDRYAENIRAEYAHVPKELFRAGRAAVLESFLARDVLFFSLEGQRRFESAARANLARELAALTS